MAGPPSSAEPLNTLRPSGRVIWRAFAVLSSFLARKPSTVIWSPTLSELRVQPMRARAFGAPWALGMTLRAAGTVTEGPSGIELLHEAIRVLQPARCMLELANAHYELGAKLRRANQRAEAREHLRSGLALAHQCGAPPLASVVRDELAATGARPRRIMLTGLESLTASERRVAELAASGLSNPEIAQRLFVTRKTVETHLGHVYLKLDISSRHDLAETLQSPAQMTR